MKDALLRRISGRAGHKGVMLLLYLVFFAVHIAAGACVSLPSVQPEEFSCALLAKYFLGADWRGALGGVDPAPYGGILQSLLYIPAILLSSDAYTQYHIALALNGAAVSLIPVLAYSCCISLGVEKRWQAALCSFCAGGFTACLLYSKFVWNESLALLMPWLALFLLIKSDKAEGKGRKMLFSFLLALTAAASICVDYRLAALVIALIITVILSIVIFRRQTVEIPVFFVSLAGLTFLAEFCNYAVQYDVWGVSDPLAMNGTVEYFIAEIPNALSKGTEAFFACFSSQLYSFVCGSWGMGALGTALVVILACRYFSANKEEKKKFSPSRGIFVTFISVFGICMLAVSVFSALEGELSTQSQLLFSRYMDGVLPFTLLFVLLFVFGGELALTEISGGIIAAAAAYMLFFFTGRYAVLEAPQGTPTDIYGIIPAMFGEGLEGGMTSTGLLSAISCSMCLMAVLLVIVSCAKRLKKAVTAAAVAALTLYSAVFGVMRCLPYTAQQSAESTGGYERISESLFNNTDAPDVTVYRCLEEGVPYLQYLNQNITVSYADDPSQIQENTYIIVTIGTDFGIPPTKLLLVRQTGDYRIYAYGERAQAYKQAQTG